jgi:hypothetical protein
VGGFWGLGRERGEGRESFFSALLAQSSIARGLCAGVEEVFWQEGGRLWGRESYLCILPNARAHTRTGIYLKTEQTEHPLLELFSEVCVYGTVTEYDGTN